MILDIDEFEDYLELQDPEVKRIIEEGTKEYLAGKGRPAENSLTSWSKSGRRPPAK